MSEQGYHIFRDPIHGFIKVNECEKAIIDSLPFQRLRRIRQLGLSNLVYHGSEHSRFGHSLGVMEFASRIFDTLWQRYKGELRELFGWVSEDDFEKNRNKLRLVSLLHDIGHPPFSHATEGLFQEGEDHETYASKIVQSGPISQIISQFSAHTGVAEDDILGVLEKKPAQAGDNFLKAIVAGEVGADRMDYLLRDSLYTGVQYGKFDADRLIETLCIVELPSKDPYIGIEERGKHAAEGLILARYFMFTQVYFHPIRRVYDVHLSRLIKRMLGKAGSSYYPSSVRDYLLLDDIVILGYAKQLHEEGGSKDADAIVLRKHFELVQETREHPDPQQDPDELYKFADYVGRLKKKYGENQIIEDVSDKAPYDYKESELYVYKKDGRYVPLSSESHLVANLRRIFQRRVYVEPSIAPAAKELL